MPTKNEIYFIESKILKILCIFNENKLYPVLIEGGIWFYIMEDEGREKFKINKWGI
jgi:hypothetical protein